MHPLPAPNESSAHRLWTAYAAAHPDRVGPGEKATVEFFGDHVALADDLVALVVSGRKRATAGLVADFRHESAPLPVLGGHWFACDGSGTPRVLLRTMELRIGPIASVDDAFAWDEGEGDRSRTDWLDQHRAYFTRTCAARDEQFTEQHEVIFERFAVVWPPDLAD